MKLFAKKTGARDNGIMSQRGVTSKKRSNYKYHRHHHHHHYHFYWCYYCGSFVCTKRLEVLSLAALLFVLSIGVSQGGNVTYYNGSEIETPDNDFNYTRFSFIRYFEKENNTDFSDIFTVRENRKMPFVRLPKKDETNFTKYDNSTKSSQRRQKNIFRTNFFRTSSKTSKNHKKIAVLGLYELSEKTGGESEDGKSELWAAKLAVEHVNKRKLFGGYELEFYTNDTKCDPGVAVDTFFHAIFSRDIRIPVLLGSACSEVTASLAYIVPYWNIVQISFGATSPVLSDRKEFPMFYRVVAPDSSHNSARLAFVRHFGWHTVTVISQNEKEYTLAVNDLVKKLEQENITCRGAVTFGENDFEDQLQLLKDLDTRIIFGSFSKEVAPKIFCKVYELGMYGSDYAWILQGNFNDLSWKWWIDQIECPQKGLWHAVQGLIFVSSYYGVEETESFFSEFVKDDLSKKSEPISKYARESYDAVWTAAIALNNTILNWSKTGENVKIEDFDYYRNDMSRNIFEEISRTNFTGISGPIYFQGADRIGMSAFHQLLGENLHTVALYLPSQQSLNFSCLGCEDIVWAGGQVPVSQRYLKQRIETISTEAFIAVACCTSLAIILAIIFLIFNLYFRKLKYIKLSSPRLNNIAVVGCIAVYLGVFLLGFDYATFPDVNYFPIICTAKVYFFAAGFSLAFGSIFAKTYRIHKIFIRSQGGFIKKKFLQDTQLILLVCVLLLIDGLILTLWVVVDPMERRLHNLTIEYSTTDRSVIYQPQVEICSCQHLNSWLSSLYMYKGLQLLMGVYMAWETRHVKIPGLNDSQYIGMSVYSVVITSCIVVVLANLISERPTVAYVTISTMILSSTTATLCLLFFPKVWVIFSRADNSDPVMQSMGLKLESNTRRFVMDDAKEKLYRLEVQNRVYKREVVALKAEIIRLERQIMQTIPLNNSATSITSLPCIINNEKSETEKNSPPKHLGLEIYTITDNQKFQQAVSSKTSRSSWPTEMHGILKLKRSHSFHSERKIEELLDFCPSILRTEGGLTYRVMERIRNLMKSKKSSDARRIDNNRIDIASNLDKTLEDFQNQDKRKFSLTRCLHQKYKTNNKDIIIDLQVASDEDLRDSTLFKPSRNRQIEKSNRFQHRKSNPSIPMRGRYKGSPRFPHRIVPTSSLTTLGDILDRNLTKSEIINSKEDCNSRDEKSRSLDDTRNVIFHDVEVSASSEEQDVVD